VKITDIKTFVVGNPPPHFGGRYFIFAKLSCDNGIVGYGEVYGATFSAHRMAGLAVDTAERFLIGEDPFKIERLWRRVYSAGFTQRPDATLGGVLSGLEMACWDIIGKALDKPVFELLGGRVREGLRSYSYLYPEPDDKPDVYGDPDLAAERAAAYVAKGFTAVKFDPVGPYSSFDPRQPSQDSLERSETFVRRLREAVGTKADLLFGTHGQFTTSGAIRMARRLEPYDPLWFEEPTPPDVPEEMGRLARQTTIPIATGERLTSKYEFARVLQCGAASILQMALGRVGGLLEAKKIAAMAEAHYAQIAPHLYCGPIEGAANVQISACTPNFLILESIREWGGFHAEILKKPMRWESGFVIPPEEPGLGVELDESVAEANPYNGDKLHLEMTPDPEF
jgi:2-dehydro-3-deoxyphosphogalactonate aldolase